MRGPCARSAFFFVVCLVFHALPTAAGPLLGYSGPIQFGLFLFWLWVLVTIVHGAMNFWRRSHDPLPVPVDHGQPYVQQKMMVPFKHEGVDPEHPLDLTHHVDEDARPWRADNPLPVPTERERYVLGQALPVYRVLYQRNRQPLPDRDTLENRWQEIDNPAEGVSSES